MISALSDLWQNPCLAEHALREGAGARWQFSGCSTLEVSDSLGCEHMSRFCLLLSYFGAYFPQLCTVVAHRTKSSKNSYYWIRGKLLFYGSWFSHL